MSRLRVALLGGDVSKSPSPAMHNAAFKALKLPFTYEAISVSPGNFEETFRQTRAGDFLGLNITVPYKETVPPLLDQLSPIAEKLGAVNTIVFTDAKASGDNTDIEGCLASIQELSLSFPKDFHVFILGCGGAGKVTVEAFWRLGARHFTAVSRSRDRLSSFQAWFQGNYPAHVKLETLDFTALTKGRWEKQMENHSVFVNAAPLAAIQEISYFEKIRFPKNITVVEWAYSPQGAPWIEKAKSEGLAFIDPYKILLHQGLGAFERWTGLKAPKAVMERALLESVS